jgi:hypothetical protein
MRVSHAGLVAVMLLLGAADAVAEESPRLTLTLAGAPKAVFIYQRDACDRDDIPDAPARAFRDAGGTVHLLATHFVNRALIGAELDRVRPDCRDLLRGGEDPRPDFFDDRGWLAAVYTRDGRTVFALIHDEFQGHRHPPLCPSGRYIDCWYNAITMAVSRDAGASFSLLGRDQRLIAALPYRYDPGLGKHVGYFNPTNIVERDGFLYAMVFAEPVAAQKHGSCLMRTARIEDPRAWRAWDGAAFEIAFADPYAIDDRERDAHVCEPVGKGRLRWPVTSLTRHAASGLYVALMMGAADGGSGRSGIFYALSADLIAWSEPTLLVDAVLPSRYVCGDAAPIAYPALLDPHSASRSFDSASDRAEIFFTRFNPAGCKLSMDRDLVSQAVALSPPATSPR